MKIIIVGYGTIASALLPLLTEELGAQITSLEIIDPSVDSHSGTGNHATTKWVCERLHQGNYRDVLSHLDRDTFLINLSVNVSSIDLVHLCQQKGSLYIDTCIEPWMGYYFDTRTDPADRTNYSLREAMLSQKQPFQGGPTAVIAHGANPGLVSHFVKQALLNLRNEIHGFSDLVPTTRQAWAKLASDLSIKTIHIAEHDTQVAKHPKEPNEFVNTWSIDGFIGEGYQPSELGWGSHERNLPVGAQYHRHGCKSSIYLNRPGAALRLKTWTPATGSCLGFLITHNEAISLSDYLTCFKSNKVIYRPTVNYAYHPCNDAILSLHELAGNSWHPQNRKRILHGRDITSGADYLGVLLMGHQRNAYWFGSILDTATAQKLNTESSATSLQVVAGVLAGIKWAIKNPNQGIVEAEEMDFQSILDTAKPYLGQMKGVYTDWSPIGAEHYHAHTASADRWQFENFMEYTQGVCK